MRVQTVVESRTGPTLGVDAELRESRSDPILSTLDRGLRILELLASDEAKLGMTLTELSLAEYQAISPAFSADLFDIFDLSRAMAARTATGAPSPQNVAAQLARWKKQLGGA